MKPHIYLDHAAATPLHPSVIEAMLPYQNEFYANPSSIYGVARKLTLVLEQARQRVAQRLGAKVTEIIWTSGGTESVNQAIAGVLRAHPRASWVTCTIEHEAVLSLREPMEREGHTVTMVSVSSLGIVDVQSVIKTVTDETVLISIMLANNEIGTIQPVAKIARLIAEIRQDRTLRGITLPLYLHTDACQAAGYLDVSVTRLGVDLLSMNGSKIYGPKGSGVLYVKQQVVLDPLIYGGGQERGRRSGTSNVAAAVGFATAFELVQDDRQAETQRLSNLRDSLRSQLQDKIPNLMINGHLDHRLPGNLNVCLPGLEGEALVLYLDGIGIMAATGSACASGTEDPSHVLVALGLNPQDATASLRLTLGRSTTQADIDYVAGHLPGIVKRLRSLA
jgi:cysteine desulfurase